MTQKFYTINILRQMLHKDRRRVIFNKIISRLNRKKVRNAENLKWISDHSVEWGEFLSTVKSASLIKEVQYATQKIENHSSGVLNSIPFKMGGAGCYPLIYLMVKKLRPNTVVETGVAAGFSSYAALLALQENNQGRLFSSDFPYFRVKDPEKYIGCVVPDNLKSKWKLYIDGDEKSLPMILSEIDSIDLLHYDSDKTYYGREYAMNLLSTYINENTIIIMDDIQDNPFFYNYIVKESISDWRIISYQGKYLGVIGSEGIV